MRTLDDVRDAYELLRQAIEADRTEDALDLLTALEDLTASALGGLLSLRDELRSLP